MKKVTFLIFIFLLFILLFNVNNIALAEDASNCSLCHGQVVDNFNVGPVNKDRECIICHQQFATPPTYYFGGSAHGGDSPVFVNDAYNVYDKYIGNFRAPYNFSKSNTSTWRTYASVISVIANAPTNTYRGISLHQSHLDIIGRGDQNNNTANCKRCHGSPITGTLNVANCSACHKNQAQVNHSMHGSSTDSTSQNVIDGLKVNGINVVDGSSAQNINLTCTNSNCHQVYFNASTYTFRVKTQRSDGKQLCVNCHNFSRDGYDIDKSGHGDVTAFHSSSFVAASNLDCNSCHQGSKDLINFHGGLGVTFRNNVTYDFTQNQCTACHSNNLTPKGDKKLNDLIVSANKTADSDKTNCASCHQVHFVTSGAEADTGHKSVIDAKCIGCHSDSLTQDHINKRPEKGYTCNTCHQSNVRNEVKRTIADGSTNCGGCHKEAHNFPLNDVVPADIPLYSGYQWSNPMEAAVFSGQPTTSEGQVVLTNRRIDVTAVQVKGFYKTQLVAKGWTFKSETATAELGLYSAEYGKAGRLLTIKSYNTLNNDGSGGIVTTGNRVEIWYK